jgi:hypothetical protein
MGYTRWDADAFKSFTSNHTAGRSRAEVFTSRNLLTEFDPSKFGVRESRDSVANPRSTAICLFSDVTGSMGLTAENMIRSQIDTTMREIDKRKPVSDPHLLVGAIGDAYTDRAPVQMTQFEGGVVLADQLKRIWIEGNGGGNDGESYLAAQYAVGMKTSIDCFEKRGEKGYLFTMGDEPNLKTLTRSQIERVFGIKVERDFSSQECLALAQRSYEVFHIVLKNVGYASNGLDRVLASWKPLLGERVLLLDDHTKVAELVVSTLQVLAGERVNDVAASWSGSTAVTIANAIGGLAKRGGPTGGVVRF